MNRDELAARLLATFIDELEEQVRALNAELLALEKDPDNAERMRFVFRVAHTLKGAAHAANVPLVEQACHALESWLTNVRATALPLEAQDFTHLFTATDALADAGKRLRAGADLSGSPLEALNRELDQLARTATPRKRAAQHAARPKSAEPAVVVVPEERALSVDSPPAAAAQSSDRDETPVRIRADKLDGLLASAGELEISTHRIALRVTEMQTLDETFERWASRWRQTARLLQRTAERMGEQATADLLDDAGRQLDKLGRELHQIAAQTSASGRTLTASSGDVAERVRALRMRPFADVCEALPRAVRDVSALTEKEVGLELSGTDVEADRAVLDGIRESILQLVRNAVDHGIELPEVRRLAGKPERGTVRVAASLRGDRLIVTVGDDGGGVDESGIRAALARAGRPVPDHEPLLVPVLLRGGVSTRFEASTISGRGIGLELARTAVERIGGSVDASWIYGRGTTFKLDAPVTLARIRAVTLVVGTQVFAVPTAHVGRVERLHHINIKRVDGLPVFSDRRAQTIGAPVPLVLLSRVLGPPLVERPLPDPMPVVLIQSGEQRLGVIVDHLLDEQELVLRPLPDGAGSLPHLAGAAMLPSGGVALVLNVASITTQAMAAGRQLAPASDEVEPREQRFRILVVDDSLTTRTLEQSVLQAAGYQVTTAIDGADAWQSLQENGADLVVADVEMPRMDGFTLCETIRGSKRFVALPIVLVSSLESPEQRARGLESGADAYIGKSKFDQQTLLELIAQLLGPGDE